MHLDDGISLVAMLENHMVDMISLYWMTSLVPLSETLKGYIDIIKVHDNFRRMGIVWILPCQYLPHGREGKGYCVTKLLNEEKTI
jgi:hypothetical protein